MPDGPAPRAPYWKSFRNLYRRPSYRSESVSQRNDGSRQSQNGPEPCTVVLRCRWSLTIFFRTSGSSIPSNASGFTDRDEGTDGLRACPLAGAPGPAALPSTRVHSKVPRRGTHSPRQVSSRPVSWLNEEPPASTAFHPARASRGTRHSGVLGQPPAR